MVKAWGGWGGWLVCWYVGMLGLEVGGFGHLQNRILETSTPLDDDVQHRTMQIRAVAQHFF